MNGLIEIRKILGLNQTELAILIGCSRSNISMAENGLRKLDPATLDRLMALSTAISSQRKYANAGNKAIFAHIGQEDIVAELRAKSHHKESVELKLDKLTQRFDNLSNVLHYQNVVINVEGENQDLPFTILHRSTLDKADKVSHQVLKLHLEQVAYQAMVEELQFINNNLNEIADVIDLYDDDTSMEEISEDNG